MNRALSDQNLLDLTEEKARALYAQGEEAVIFALLQLNALARQKQAGAGVDPATPSSQIPVYKKPTGKKRKAKRGQKKGHKGACRKPPLKIDRFVEHRLECCPDCGGAVGPARATRTRVIEDIQQAEVETTEHTIHAHYCPRCKKRVEAKVLDALPKSTLGTRALALSAWLHYGLGQTISQVAALFDSLFHFEVSAGGLSQQWARLAVILLAWYEQIAEQARASAVLHADETGWRVEGQTHWLWCFVTPTLSYYVIDRTRGSPVVNGFLGDCYQGTLITDFYSAYNKVTANKRQVCMVHLLRELAKVTERNESDEWISYWRTLRRVLKDALRLARRADREAPDYASKRARIHQRLDCIVAADHADPDCKRLNKRLTKHREDLFTFLDDPRVAPDNNRAEREMRPAVIARKNSYQNASPNGARTQAVLMTVYRTLKLRGHDPLQTIADALAAYIATGKLPPLPGAPTA